MNAEDMTNTPLIAQGCGLVGMTDTSGVVECRHTHTHTHIRLLLVRKFS